jgi:hypothetical protein
VRHVDAALRREARRATLFVALCFFPRRNGVRIRTNSYQFVLHRSNLNFKVTRACGIVLPWNRPR